MNKNNMIFIIAEAGVNHNGSVDRAKKMVDAAAEAGADAVKFQTFNAARLASASAPKADYQRKTTSARESQFEMLRKLELDEEKHLALASHCRTRGVQFLSTPFDDESIDLLTRTIRVPLLKLSSGEITNGPLLLKAARSRKPIILSTGMSTLGEIETALGVLAFGYTDAKNKPCCAAFRRAYRSPSGNRALKAKVTLLHCTTEYPASFNDVNLRAMDTMGRVFGLQIGLSDHTVGIAVSIAAAARGASVIEKHFTLDRSLPGPDHKASLTPGELYQLVKSIREVEVALGSERKGPARSELKNMKVARKSLVALEEIRKGDIFTSGNLGCKRPGTGCSPMYYWQLLGEKSRRRYRKDDLVQT